MPEQILTYTNEEVARMLENGELRLLTAPEPIQKPLENTEHEKALEKAKRLFGKEFEDVQTLEIGGKTAEQLKQALNQGNINVSIWAEDILDSPDFTILPNPQNIEIIKLKIKDLGFEEEVTTQQIYQKAEELGLELCPAEAGPHLRLKDIDQSLGDGYTIAMKQITDWDGDPSVFDLARDGDGLWLHSRWARPGRKWAPEFRFVFVSRNDT